MVYPAVEIKPRNLAIGISGVCVIIDGDGVFLSPLEESTGNMLGDVVFTNSHGDGVGEGIAG